MGRIRVYTTLRCGYCVRAKALLEDRGLPYDEIRLDDEFAGRVRLHELTGGWTVPQIVVDERPIGGFAELVELARRGLLDDLSA